MGRVPIGRKAMSNAERQRRRRERLKPLLKVERLKRAFLDADPPTQAEFLYWIRRYIK
jgi:hypothetical protein